MLSTSLRISDELQYLYQAVKPDMCCQQRALSQPLPHYPRISGSLDGALNTSRRAPTSSLTTLKPATTAAQATAGEAPFSQAECSAVSVLSE